MSKPAECQPGSSDHHCWHLALDVNQEELRTRLVQRNPNPESQVAGLGGVGDGWGDWGGGDGGGAGAGQGGRDASVRR